MVGTPGFVLNGRLDLLAANQLGFALFSLIYGDPARPPNTARFMFLDPQATEFFCDWDKVANARSPCCVPRPAETPTTGAVGADRGAVDRSEEFRVRWAAHHVRIHTSGVKRFHHPVAGDLELAFESFPLAADPSQSLLTYTAEPGSPSQDALRLLASWAATTATSSGLRAPTTPSRLSRSRRPTDQVNLDEPQRAEQQAGADSASGPAPRCPTAGCQRDKWSSWAGLTLRLSL